jgi:hypothetical protein
VIEGLFDIALLGAVVPGLQLVPGARVDGPRLWIAAAAAVLLAVAMFVPAGPMAGALAVPWMAVAVVLAVSRVPRLWARRSPARAVLDGIAADVACAFLAVGATWAVVSCLGLRPMGFDDRIVLLTAVHFHVAGFVLVLAGELLRRARPIVVTAAGLTALIVGIPMTAAGFLGIAVAGFVGAWLVAGGAFVVGLGHVWAGLRGAGPAAAFAGISLMLSMTLAAAWATAAWRGVDVLSVPAMAAVHGGLNVLGFALPATIAWRRVASG